MNCTADHNKGASAISWGLVNRLTRSELVERVTLVAKETIDGESDYRHTRERFGDTVSLEASPLVVRQRGSKAYSLRNAAPLLGPTLGTYLPAYRRSLARRDRAAEAIATSDVIFSRGGPFFSASGPYHVGLRLAWPFLYARQGGVPYAIVSEGVGPFDNRWARGFHKWLFEGASLITVRDELSRERLAALGLPPARIQAMLDNAFWVAPSRTTRVDEILSSRRLVPGRFLAVTVRIWGTTASTYLPELARAIDKLVPAMFDDVVLVPNTFRPENPGSHDRGSTRTLYELIAHNPRAHLVDVDLTPEELAALYGLSGVTLGTRLHSVILALVGGAPVVAVSYLPKTNGVMSGLDLGEFVMGIHDFRHERAVELVRRAAVEQRHTSQLLDRRRRDSDEQLQRFLASVALTAR
ncbi:MAG: polysaccharide pyruvyl transferase family protein [Acidimicrobiia bacterium]|nr:polysaccharide pyruvyl transferase family protein [Acidimicrobiia bacterium]